MSTDRAEGQLRGNRRDRAGHAARITSTCRSWGFLPRRTAWNSPARRGAWCHPWAEFSASAWPPAPVLYARRG